MGTLNQIGGENGEFIIGTDFGGGNFSSSNPYKKEEKMKKVSIIVSVVVIAVSMVVLTWPAPASLARRFISISLLSGRPATSRLHSGTRSG